MRSDEMFTRACSEDVPSIIGLRHRIWGGTVIGEDLSNEESWQNSVTYQFTLA